MRARERSSVLGHSDVKGHCEIAVAAKGFGRRKGERFLPIGSYPRRLGGRGGRVNTCTRVTVWHVAFHGPPAVVLASTRDTLPRGIYTRVYAARLFNGGRSRAI